MNAQHLRHRITPEFKADRAQYAEQDTEEGRLWEQGLPIIQYHDDLDERHLAQGQSVRSAHNAQRRGVERLFRLMANVYVEVQSGQHPNITFEEDLAERLYQAGWGPLITEYFEARTPATPQRIVRVARNRRDVKENFLYEEWSKQTYKPNAIKSYAAYALYVTLKAAHMLIIQRPGGSNLIQRFYSGEVPDRDQLIRLSEHFDIMRPPRNLEMSGLLAVANMLELAEALILHYADFVRAERVDKSDTPMLRSPLPDDPLEWSLPARYDIPEDIRMETGHQAYLAKEGSADSIASKYNLPVKKFRQYLQDTGAMKPRGGDRKA